jgi:predicted DNA-binding transcriptional regulator AlpA
MRKRLRYRDLVALGIVANRITLRNWIRDRGFPRGVLLGPNSRSWAADEVETWIASRPSSPKRTPLTRMLQGTADGSQPKRAAQARARNSAAKRSPVRTDTPRKVPAKPVRSRA